MSKPAQINDQLATWCEAIARKRRKATGDDVRWSRILSEALEIGLKRLERQNGRK